MILKEFDFVKVSSEHRSAKHRSAKDPLAKSEKRSKASVPHF